MLENDHLASKELNLSQNKENKKIVAMLKVLHRSERTI